jgi:Tol biopolymer transport system component
MFSNAYTRIRRVIRTAARGLLSLCAPGKYAGPYTLRLQGGTLCLFLLVALSVQGCLGLGGPGGQQVATGSNGQQVSVNQDVFTGRFYLTINHNLFVLSGDNTTRELVATGDVYDPAVSPDGKWIAFIERHKQYSDLCAVAATGGSVRVLRSGAGRFYANGPFIHNTFKWYAQPAWSADSSTLLFLSDLEKEDWYQQTGRDAPLLDMQVFSVSFQDPAARPRDIAYATFGDGGDRDASYRPGHPDQIIYTHYTYDAATQTQQDIQLYMENPETISAHPGVYYPGSPGGGFDPSVAITTPDLENIQPIFSPDGSAIAYIQRNKNQTQMSLQIMPAPPASITSTPNDTKTEALALQAYKAHSSHLLSQLYIEQPVWSPDGKQIAYIQYTGGAFDLWIVKVSYDAKTGKYRISGSPIQVTSGGIDGESRPVWIL